LVFDRVIQKDKRWTFFWDTVGRGGEGRCGRGRRGKGREKRERKEARVNEGGFVDGSHECGREGSGDCRRAAIEESGVSKSSRHGGLCGFCEYQEHLVSVLI